MTNRQHRDVNSKQLLARYRAAARVGDPASQEFLHQLRCEEREACQAAKMFVDACVSGNVEAFWAAVDALNESVGGWKKAITYAARLTSANPVIQHSFLAVWVESKMLNFRSGSRVSMLKAVRTLLPRTEVIGPVRLFRGAAAIEQKRRAYGLSWTTDRAVADRFAQERRRWDGGSVLFEALAPPDAILHVLEHVEGYYEEAEHVVDPERLARVKVIVTL